MNFWCLIGLHNWMPNGPEKRYCFDCPKKQELVECVNDEPGNSGPHTMKCWRDVD
jgi:hypothetical protein